MRQALAASLAMATALALIAIAGAGTNSNYVTHLNGAEEVPVRETLAQGQFLAQLSPDGTELRYRLIVANIDNVTAAHIHVAPAGVNGPVVVGLASGAAGSGPSDGVLATGTITAANLTGPLAGQPLSALIEAMDAGDTYVNVHTTTNPAGEIRGQIEENPEVNPL